MGNNEKKLMKRNLNLPPATEFWTLEEIAQRWRRQPLTVDRLLRYTFKIPVYRITAKQHLYSIADVKAIEQQAKTRAPLLVRTTWRKNPKEAAAP
jgi:hypothetical protein